jgi:hypothetical protein
MLSRYGIKSMAYIDDNIDNDTSQIDKDIDKTHDMFKSNGYRHTKKRWP